MAKGKRKGPIKRGTMHSVLRSKGNQARAAAARMQSDGKLWKKDKHGARKSGTGTEKDIKFHKSIDKARAKVGGTDTKKSWLNRIMKNAGKWFKKSKKKA